MTPMNATHPSAGLAHHVTAIRTRIAAAQSEMVTGRLADPVSELGAGRGQAISWEGEADRLDRVRETNALTAGRLDATATALGRLRETGEGLVRTLVAATSGGLDRDFLAGAAAAARQDATGVLNMTFDGAHLFAGVTSDVAPIRDGAEAAAALEARFAAAFGHPSDDPSARAIAPDEAAAFARDAADWLAGPGWALVCDASDEPVTARIAPGERIDASVSANATPARQLFAAAFVAERLFGAELDDEGLAASGEALLGTAASSAAGLARAEGTSGLAQARVERADARLAEDADALRALARQTLGVDPFEAAQRLNADVVQLETAYTLTARLSELSLMRFL